jgi:hypothetical protein
MRTFNKAALDNVLYAALGVYLQYQAWRKNVTGIAQAPLPLFWGVSKTPLRQPLTYQACEQIGYATGGKPDDQAHWPRWIGLCPRHA